MAAIFRGKPRDKFRLPQRPERMRGADRGETGVARVDKKDISVRINTHFVNVDVAGQVRATRRVKSVEHVIGQFVRPQNVFEPPDFVPGSEIDGLRIGD
jgi:hypothetical protein